MSSPIPQLISEYTHIKFDIDDSSHCVLVTPETGFMLDLQVSADKASMQFKEVVACRSLLLLKSDNVLRHEQIMWSNKGPFNAEQFLKIIKFKTGISNEEWHQYIIDAGRVNVLPT